MEKIKQFLEDCKLNNRLTIFVVDEGDGSPYTIRGKVLDFDNECVEIQTFTNMVLLKLDHISKIKCKNGENEK